MLIGIPSSGLHTNGYSLARKIIFEEKGLKPDDAFPGMDRSVTDVLLAIHRPYFKKLEPLLAQDQIAAMAHITGGGFLDNIPRVLPETLDARIRLDAYTVPPLFRYLAEEGGLDRDEAYRVFNMGIGMILAVAPDHREAVLSHLTGLGEEAVVLGEIIEGTGVVQLV